jgi:signal recognition particle subunit SRP68
VPASDGSPNKTPLSLSVSAEDVEYLQNLLNGELQRHRAIVHVDVLRKKHELSVSDAVKRPLIETQNHYPSGGVNLDHIVEFPPKLATIPVKPIFLDVAWNYIDYAGKAPLKQPSALAKAEEPKRDESPAPQQAKKGWFGFGRS